MCNYENAIRILAQTESPCPPDLAPEEYKAWLDDLVVSKFTYIVASQVLA